MKKEQGFAYVEVIVIIVAVSILGFVGYKVTQNEDKPVNTSTNQITETEKTDSDSTEADKETKALAVVTSVYDKYVAVKDGSTEEAVANAKAKSTDAFVAKQTEGFDYYICAQEIPMSVSYGDPVVNGNNIVFKVTEKYAESNVVVTVTVDSKENKISDVTCE